MKKIASFLAAVLLLTAAHAKTAQADSIYNLPTGEAVEIRQLLEMADSGYYPVFTVDGEQAYYAYTAKAFVTFFWTAEEGFQEIEYITID